MPCRCATGTSPSRSACRTRPRSPPAAALDGVRDVGVAALDEVPRTRRARETASQLPVRRPAASTCAHQSSSVPKRPAYVLPNVVTIQPVSVARSTSRSPCALVDRVREGSRRARSGPRRRLRTSIVVPVLARRMSPGLTACPLGRFSVAPITDTTRAGAQPGDRAGRLQHGRGADIELHLAHLRRRDRDAAGVESPLPTKPSSGPAAPGGS